MLRPSPPKLWAFNFTRVKLPAVVLFLLVCSTCTYGQGIRGKVIDDETRLPLANILVSAGNSRAFTNIEGEFSLNALQGDTLRISVMTYRAISIPVAGWGSGIKIITLQPRVNSLNGVTITARKNYKADSVRLRQDYAKQFNFRGPRFNEIVTMPSLNMPFAYVSINVGQLFNAITKKSSPNYKLQQVLLRAEAENHVSARFNKSFVQSLTKLTGDSLANFMTAYRPTATALDKLNDYDLVRYIQDNVKKFRVKAQRLDELPVMLKPGQSLAD